MAKEMKANLSEPKSMLIPDTNPVSPPGNGKGYVQLVSARQETNHKEDEGLYFIE
jgi:hypothetical protein